MKRSIISIITLAAFTNFCQAEELKTIMHYEIVTPYQTKIIGNISHYASDNNKTLEDIFTNESLVQSMDTLPPEWTNYIRYLIQPALFINYSNECRWAIFAVNASTGYNQIFHHRAEPFITFPHPPQPPIGGGGGWTSSTIITSMPCSSTPPGIPY